MAEVPLARSSGTSADAQLRLLPGLSHVPISDDPGNVSRLMLKFLSQPEEARARGRLTPSTR